MERETKEFKTTLGTTLKIKTYLTGLESRTIEGKYLSMAKMDIKAGEPTFKDVDLNVGFEVEKELIKIAVVSVNENKENILETILNLRSEEYEEIVGELNNLTKKKVK